MDEGQFYPRLVGPSRAAGGTTLLEIRGELDILAVSVLSDRLDDITGAQGVDLVLDVRAVTFIDCAGLSLLSRARQRTRQRGGRLRLTGAGGGGSVARLLRMTGLEGSFDLVPDDAARDTLAGAAGPAGVTDGAGTAVA